MQKGLYLNVKWKIKSEYVPNLIPTVLNEHTKVLERITSIITMIFF